MNEDILKALYQQYTRNNYRVILTTGYSHLNEFRDLKNAHAYAIAKKPVGHGWQKSPSASLEKCIDWMNKDGWLAVVLPDNLVAVDVDGSLEDQDLYAKLNTPAGVCGIHNTNNGKHYIYTLPADQVERERIKSAADVISKCGLLLTYRLGGKSNIIVAPSNGREWLKFCDNAELSELPSKFCPLDLKDIPQVEKALWFQLGQAYRNKLIQGNEHIDMMLMGALVKKLDYKLAKIEGIYEEIYRGDYNAAQTRANYARVAKMDQAQGAKSLFEVLKEKGLQNIEILLNALLNAAPSKSENHPTSKEKGPSYKEMNLWVINYIIENKVIYKEKEGVYYRYEGGLYVSVTLQTVMARFQKILTVDHASPSRLNHMKSFFLNYFEENKYTENDELKLLTANDKVFDLQTLKVREKNENEVFFNRLNVNYNPLAKTVRWDKFLCEIFPGREEIISYLQEFMGYSLTLMTKFEMALVFRGEGANGKSVLLHVWEYILGKHNISNLSMSQLSGEYTQAMLQNKLLNICHEIGVKEFIPEATLKRMISGEEITVNRKYKDAITFKPYAKLVFSSNNHVLSLDKSNGTVRRYVFIPFTVDFESPELRDRKDPDLKYRLVREEGDGIFMWMLEGLRRLLVRGHFDIPLTLAEHTKNENNDTNPIFEFASEYVYWGCPGDFVTSKRIYNEYKKFCAMYGYLGKSHQGFTTDFKRLFRNGDAFSIIKNNNRGFRCMRVKEVPYDMQKRIYEVELEQPSLFEGCVNITKMTWKEYNESKNERF